jgi:hypothetical protein
LNEGDSTDDFAWQSEYMIMELGHSVTQHFEKTTIGQKKPSTYRSLLLKKKRNAFRGVAEIMGLAMKYNDNLENKRR